MSTELDLLAYGRNVTSEHGEDGVLERIFEIIGEGGKWCVELGALNGKHGSNVWHLMKERGWSGVLIEADRTYFARLQEEYADNPNAHCVQAFVSLEGTDSLDSIFARTPIPREFDLFVLDIDGADYHLWDSLTQYRPRVMLIEFNPSIPHEVEFVQPRDMSVFQGSSLRSIVSLAHKKGYELIAANEGNAFFVLRELFPKFAIEDNSLDALHRDRRHETKLFQLYDGTLRISGETNLIWHHVPIDVKKLQVLPEHKRRYPARVSEHKLVRDLKYVIRKAPFYRLLQRIRLRLKP